MKVSKTGPRFAQALLDLSLEHGSLEAVKADMTLIAETVGDNRELELMLGSPVIKPATKIKVLESIFGKHISALSLSFLKLLCAKGRESHIGSIAVAFTNFYNQHKNIVSVQVTTAVAMTDGQRAAVLKALNTAGASVQIRESVDSSLMGGVRVQVGDQRVDASLHRKLNDLKKTVFSNHIPTIK